MFSEKKSEIGVSYGREVTTVERWSMQISQQLFSIIQEPETQENLVRLKSFLKLADITDIVGTPTIMEIQTTKGIERVNIPAASIAIIQGKSIFFEALISKCPSMICNHSFMSVSTIGANGMAYEAVLPARREIPVESPLKVAILQRTPSLVTTVLRNQYFMDHAFKEPQKHLEHVNYCISKAREWFARTMTVNETEVLRLLEEMQQFRMPLISAMKAATSTSDLSSVSTILTNIDFIEHEYEHPLAHKSLLNDCIECAKRWCSAQPKVLEELQKANSI